MHPKFAKRLATIYVDKLVKEGHVGLIEWAERAIPRSAFEEVKPIVHQLLKARGIRVK